MTQIAPDNVDRSYLYSIVVVTATVIVRIVRSQRQFFFFFNLHNISIKKLHFHTCIPHAIVQKPLCIFNLLFIYIFSIIFVFYKKKKNRIVITVIILYIIPISSYLKIIISIDRLFAFTCKQVNYVTKPINTLPNGAQ